MARNADGTEKTFDEMNRKDFERDMEKAKDNEYARLNREKEEREKSDKTF